jgi:hypothetical protein
MIQAEKLSKVYWDNSRNASRIVGGLYKDQKDEHRLISLLVPGWDVGLGRVLATPMTEEEQKTAVEALKTRHAELQGADLSVEPEEVKLGDGKVTFTKPEQLIAFEAVHCDKNGKIITPKFRGVTCYRRGNTLLKVNTIRMKKGMEPITELPVSVKEYTDNAVGELEDNLIENVNKTKGSRGVNDSALLAACREMFKLGASESKFQKRIFDNKRGMAQKVHRLCRLDKAYPDLRIIDRIIDPEDDLTAKPFDKEKVKGLLDKGASIEEVKAFVDAPNKGNAPKIMSRKDIEALQEQTPVKLVALALQAVIKNDVGILAHVTAAAAEINKATEAWIS